MVEGLTEAWCIAKIQRLVGKIQPPIENDKLQEHFAVADFLESSTFEHPDTKLKTRFIQVGTLRQELERLSGPKVESDLLDFIEYLLVLDHTKRPTALEALKHPYLESIA
jgi:serine/threonine protein kinase